MAPSLLKVVNDISSTPVQRLSASTSSSPEMPSMYGEVDTIGLARATILQFLERTKMINKIRTFPTPPEVDNTVRNTVDTWNVDIPRSALDKYIDCVVHFGHMLYRHASYDVQVSIALYTLCSLFFEDGVISRDAAREFVPRLASGQPQLHPLLERYVECTLKLREHLPPYGGNALISATLDFANFELLRSDELLAFDIKPGALDFIEYVRQKDGFAEGYVAAIWPKSDFPDVKTYIQVFADVSEFMCKSNDVFSFYKETKAGETTNYVSQYAMVHGRSISEAVVEITERTILLVNRIRDTLGEGKEREAFEGFAFGYIQWHIYSPRYRLHEVVPMFF